MKQDYLLGKRKDHRWTGAEILLFRKAYGLSQSELAQLIGCRQQTVSDWEKALNKPSWSFSSLLTNLEQTIHQLWLEAGAMGGRKNDDQVRNMKKLLKEKFYGHWRE